MSILVCLGTYNLSLRDVHDYFLKFFEKVLEQNDKVSPLKPDVSPLICYKE